jgi:hypothetical protein
MILALAWLTVSTPFVFAEQQRQAAMALETSPGETEECFDPFASTTEEKTEGGANTLSEFLHDHHIHLSGSDLPLKHEKCHTANVYVAYHGELLSPPPEA